MVVLLVICILYVIVASLLIHGARKVLKKSKKTQPLCNNLTKIITHRARLACWFPGSCWQWSPSSTTASRSFKWSTTTGTARATWDSSAASSVATWALPPTSSSSSTPSGRIWTTEFSNIWFCRLQLRRGDASASNEMRKMWRDSREAQLKPMQHWPLTSTVLSISLRKISPQAK